MMSSLRTAVRGSFAAKGTRQAVGRTYGFAIGGPNTAAGLTGRASDLGWRDAKQPVSAAV
jgi:S-adenosylmethionine synthetase